MKFKLVVDDEDLLGACAVSVQVVDQMMRALGPMCELGAEIDETTGVVTINADPAVVRVEKS